MITQLCRSFAKCIQGLPTNLSNTPDEKRFSQEYYPKRISIQVHSINTDQKPHRIISRIRIQEKRCSAIPYAFKIQFELNYHSLMFDTMKIDILKKHLLVHIRFGQVAIKLCDLPNSFGELMCSFPIKDIKDKTKELGSIMLILNFELPTSLQKGQNHFPSPSSVDGGVSPTMLHHTDFLEDSFENKLLTSARKESFKDAKICAHPYYKRSQREGLSALKQIYAALCIDQNRICESYRSVFLI
jgi:hypothetical protein